MDKQPDIWNSSGKVDIFNEGQKELLELKFNSSADKTSNNFLSRYGVFTFLFTNLLQIRFFKFKLRLNGHIFVDLH